MASRPAQFAEPITTKRVCFYKSGDPQFRGLKMIINNRTFKTFDALLDTLSKRVPLPFGVRNISTPRGIHVISTLDELEDGKSYICSDQKKVKPIDLEVASKKPKPWHCTRPVSGRRRAIQLKKQNEGQLFQRENSVVVRTPKKIVVFKNGDAGIKHTLMLQKKTAQTFESLLDLVTEVMQFPVLKLYTPDGRRVDGLQALILCSGVVVATGREPFKAGKYDPQRQSLPTKLPGISNRVNPKPINKIQQRNLTVYEAHVVTGDLWNAGTEANVYITVYGEKGDTGSRQLLNSRKPIKFCKGQTDIFTLEAVNLGSLRKVVIGHNGLGQGNGWFLEKVVLIDSWKDMEYTFLCNRWLDQGEEDGKIVRELYTADSFTAKQELEHKIKEIWAAERWKFQKGNIVQLCCRLTGKCVCLYPDGTVDALGDKKDTHGYFDMTVKRGNIRVFHSLQNPHLALSIDQNRVTALENGGTLCELQVCIQPSRFVTLESVRIPGFNVTFNPEGSPADGATSYSGLSREFVVHVKGVLRNGAVVLLNSSLSQSLCITRDGQCVGTGKQAEESYLRVHKISSGVYMFESVQTPKMYLKIKDGRCDGTGTGDQYCQFKVEKHFQNGSLSLESLKMRGMYIGLLPDGRAKPLVHTGETNIMFYPQVIKYGREKPTGTSANLNKETKAEQEPVKHFTPAPPASPISHRREIKNRRVVESLVPSGDQWSVSVLTGSEGTQAGVFLWVYGDQGVAGPIMLGRANRTKLFVPGQEDAFQVDLFQLEAVSLGKLQRVLLRCEAQTKSQYWYCEKVIIRESGEDSEYIFNCERWLPYSSQGIVKSDVELLLQAGDWKVTVVTGDFHSASTEATVFLFAYGDIGESGPIILGSGKHQLFNPNSADTFQINLKDLGELYKLRIGHDNTGEDPGWYLEEVILHELATQKEMSLPVRQWLAEDKDVGDVWKELAVHQTNKKSLPVLVYQVYVYTGSRPGADTDSAVYINIFGSRGDTGKRKLHKSVNQKVIFQQGQVDIFSIEAVSLAELRKVVVEHRGTGPVNQYLVSVHTGDTWGAETYSNVYITLYGERGDTGVRKLHRSLVEGQKFQRNKVDSFLLEAVSLGHLKKVVVGHDGEGYGAGMYLKLVTVQESERSSTERVFPCFKWLDEHIGTQSTVCKLKSVGRLSSFS
ncbi:Oxygen-regulated protein 1 [Acipenser ruthenus]|uniref:Oxygen-regulated protein 1 n=1 Tax=Acipenser ruthenus TaxID=7906 RepID=A0A444UDL6_ACIRT|nr:Oxygen-regulated protein 1 [Acipenser ruthenus]